MNNPIWNDRLAWLGTVISAVVGLISAFNMRDHVRMVDILSLLFGGIGVGIGAGAALAKMHFKRESSPEPGVRAKVN